MIDVTRYSHVVNVAFSGVRGQGQFWRRFFGPSDQPYFRGEACRSGTGLVPGGYRFR